jgi:hypothetical protein
MVTAKQQHATPSYQITRVTSQNGPIGEKKSFVSEEDKHIKSSLGDTQNTGNLVTPIDKDTTVAVITVTNELPVSNQDSLKSDVCEPIKQLPPEASEVDWIRAGHQKYVSKKKCTCHICDRVFPYELTSDFDNGISGYICTTCHMEHRTREKPAPVRADTQSKL